MDKYPSLKGLLRHERILSKSYASLMNKNIELHLQNWGRFYLLCLHGIREVGETQILATKPQNLLFFFYSVSIV